MRLRSSSRRQRGATLMLGLIMLVLITLVVTTAFTLSTTNLKAVGNMQMRNEAIAAANAAIEQVLSSPFTTAPVAETITVDINNDGTNDYDVNIAVPTCIRASVAADSSLSSLSLPTSMSSASFWNTIWDIDATVTDAASGTAVRVRSGMRVKLSDSQKNISCP